MEKIIKILMRRDEMDYDEAKEFVEDVIREVMDAVSVGDYELAMDIFESDLGLEPDYLMDALI